MLILIEDNQSAHICPDCILDLWTRVVQASLIASSLGFTRDDSDYRIMGMQLRDFANKLATINREFALMTLKYN